MLGVIGGTGLYKIEGFENVTSKKVATPFGEPSSEVLVGQISGREIAFLPRHGAHHQILPSEINYRANIWALKEVGARRLISISAVGSLREEIQPGDLALPDQYFDWTKKRAGTFFGSGIVAHISSAQPVCPSLTEKIWQSAELTGNPIHRAKTYACVEGPRLGTRAESLFLRQIGCDIVGMTNLPEAFLAREAQLCYATIAVSTDYDCWLDDPTQHATVDKVIELYKKNIGRVQELLKAVVKADETTTPCQCRTALEYALLTDPTKLNKEQQEILAFLKE